MALHEKGEEVHIWNRTLSKAKVLEQKGISIFNSPAGAVKDAKLVHLALKDDDSVDQVLHLAESGLQQGAIIIDHTTTSAAGAVKRSKEWAKKGFKYQHAPVLMGPQNARERTGFMLVSGNQDLISQLSPTLSAMTGKLLNLGIETGKAASMKLAANLFLISLNGGIADMLTFSRASGVTTDDILALLKDWNPGTSAAGRIRKVAEGDLKQPSWELVMARKDAGLMIDGARSAGKTLPVIAAIAAEMDGLIEKGFGHYDWSVIAKGELKE